MGSASNQKEFQKDSVLEDLDHPNARSCHLGKGLSGEDVYVVMTDIPTDPSDPHYSEIAFETLGAAVRHYLAKHSRFARATIVYGAPEDVTQRSKPKRVRIKNRQSSERSGVTRKQRLLEH